MASLAITVTQALPATIESTTSQARITKTSAQPSLRGFLSNAGATTTWLAINQANALTAVATTNAQATGTIPLNAGATIPWAFWWNTIDHLSTGSTTLVWIPQMGSLAED